jgi:hypothetical protein
MKSSLHIFIGDSDENTGASGLVQKLARTGGLETWSCVQTARAGARALIYVDKPQSALVAKATVLKGAKPGKRGDFPYRATLGQFELLETPITLDELKKTFPDWGWLRFPRSKAVVPEQHADRLWKLVHRKHGKDVAVGAETGSRAQPIFGDKLYQQRARAALPLLVSLAGARGKIYYGQLAKALGIPNPRTLNYVLGSVGQTLLQLGQEWRKTIPPIQCLVINQSDELPGDGVGFFIDKKRFKLMSKAGRRRVVDKVHEKIWAYQKWDSVLSALSLHPATNTKAQAVHRKAIGQGGGYGNPKENRLVEAAAVRRVTKDLRKQGYRVASREKDGIGYDLDAIRSDGVLHVEVKGVSGGLPQFQITVGEVKCAQSDPEFRLYVVTKARTATAKVHPYSGQEFKSRFHLDPTAFRATPT